MSGTVEVSIVYTLPESQVLVSRQVSPGTTVAELLEMVRAEPPFASLDLANVPVGIYGVVVERTRVLVEGDRVELYRPLMVDPKAERRRRAREG